MQNNVPLSAQIESEVVALVNVFNAGLRRYSVKSGIKGATTLDPVDPPPAPPVVVGAEIQLNQTRQMRATTAEKASSRGGSNAPRERRMKMEMKMKVEARC
jgi:hypothetical protein